MEHQQPGAAEREAERERGRYAERRAVAREQLAQIQEHRHQADLAKLENRREGEEIQRLNRLYQLEIQRGKENEQEEKIERQRLHHEHVAEQKVIKDEEKQRENQDDDRIRAYIKGKEMMADLRREEDAETNRLVQEHQDKAFKQLAGQMNQTLRMEAERFARGAAEVEDEYQMKTKEREAKTKAAIESIAEHRDTVVKMKLEKEIEEKAESAKECHAFMEKNRIYLEGEEAKKQRQRDASMEVQKIQLQQMVNRSAVPCQPLSESSTHLKQQYDALRGWERKHAVFC
ncbi:coiled-coil domain-containing protein 173-like [Oxyura jamaicensis]|uniref:coiled-coil domain-containing protein 173-like n=1 Tax=Oxyura jamaicensis TaxID=8884 RepID=UPI0015A5E630|nr:coiled-coil domain-containing protein 173-like [Oxyura jamaicensis]XP_035167912.1 coiled-coil domain-containing protein 173-like [Oxyura jamaicensis]